MTSHPCKTPVFDCFKPNPRIRSRKWQSNILQFYFEVPHATRARQIDGGKTKLQIRLSSYAGNVSGVQAGVAKMDGSAPIGILVGVMNEPSSSLTLWQITLMLLFHVRFREQRKKCTRTVRKFRIDSNFSGWFKKCFCLYRRKKRVYTQFMDTPHTMPVDTQPLLSNCKLQHQNSFLDCRRI